jgi:positive regulator of sigma E activity
MSDVFTRRLRVVALDAGQARLVAMAACEACAGCSGRCHGILSGFGGGRDLVIGRDLLPQPLAVGDEVLLHVAPDALARRGLWIHGVPLAGLIGGALGALALAPAGAAARDALAAAGGLAGLSAGIALAALIGTRATPAFRFASCPSQPPRSPPCDPQTDS